MKNIPVLLAVSVFAIPLNTFAQAPRKPNVIVITTDDQR